ncbi:hypothetical protein EUTSA_v10003468mg [Eutrema salsugineum]|uniref:MBD domain-containing protein n=1 Tax=Eutrema salsugineum TaxID=72664 RepID=V4LLD9_EUTSA|nr:hypothetical protein EUTSA_v10003468mg [Eutrema salsugineum]
MSQWSGNVSDFHAVQPSWESGSSFMGNDTVQSEPPKTRKPSLSIEAFTVQCNTCLKWRVIPSEEKYEVIREKLEENLFYCETASEWKPGMSCDVPENVSQYRTSVWALDRPGIPCPPAGWKRSVRFRNEGSTRFADVYYATPSGYQLRSYVEVQKYLDEYPQYKIEGVNISQFSFQMPIPLQENYELRTCD